MEDANEFTTPDFYIASFLIAKGHKLINAKHDGSKRVFFAFDDFEGRKDLLRAFLYGEAVVEPQAFIAAIKSLKQLLHSCND